MQRIFIFSYHGTETFQTSYYRLLNLASFLAKDHQIYFVHGAENSETPIEKKGNLIEIALKYNEGWLQQAYALLIKNKYFTLGKLLLMIYYFLTGKEIYDLGQVFDKYLSKTNLSLNERDTVIVSYPSIAIHNLGYRLKKKYGCKLVLDYRDPGVFGYQLISESKIVSFLRKTFLKRRELRNLDAADGLTAISASIKNLFPPKYATKFSVIRNGFLIDKVDFSKIKTTNNIFKLVYLGTIYNIQLQELDFFKAVRKFINHYGLQPHQFQLKFVGSETPIRHKADELKLVVKQLGLDPYTTITPRMPIEQAYEHLYDANMFLHLRCGDRKEIITSKQYEYLAFQKPILLPISDEGDLAESIQQYDAGFVCHSVEEIVQTLSLQFELHLAQISNRVQRTEQELFELSRQYQGQKFRKLIKALRTTDGTKAKAKV